MDSSDDPFLSPGPEREAAISRMVFDVLDAGIVVQGPLGRVAIANPAAARILGLDLDDLIGSRVDDIPRRFVRDDGSPLGPEDFPGRVALRTGRRQVGVMVGFERPGDDGMCWLEVSSQPLTWRGVVFAAVSAIHDVTKRRVAEDALRVSERRQGVVLQHAVGGYAIIGDDGELIDGSRSVYDWLGRNAPASGASGWDRVQDREVARRVFHQARDHPGLPQRAEVQVVDDDGRVRWMEMTATDQRAEPAVRGVVVNYRDVTDRKHAEQALEHEALHDPVTGLPNRRVLADRLSHALARADRAGGKVAVLFFDLDHFKLVNDSLGHPAGDAVLQTLADRFRTAARESDTVVRFGGDEFVVVCEDLERIDQALEIAERLRSHIEEPFAIEHAESTVTVSIGVAFGSPTDEPSSLLRDADAAMNLAKEKGRARIEVFSEDLRNRATRRLDLDNALRRALERHELHVVYQPVISLASGRPVGTEALLRWDHATRGPISPTEFIPLAERSGLIVPIGAWVVEHALTQVATWRGAGAPAADLWVAVNLSARQIDAPELVATVEGALARTGVHASRLHLEITETSLLGEVGSFVDQLDSLTSLGVHLSIDDFGTGYSSLSYLKRLPIDTLKIDRSFTDGLGTDSSDRSIVDAILSLGRALELDVVAEGVENDEQLTELRQLGCDYAQGYHWTRPLPPDELEGWLERRSGRRTAS